MPKICQFCGKYIADSAIKCPYCGEWLTAPNNSASCGIGIRNPIVICIAVVAFLFWLRMLFIGRADSIFVYYFMLVFIIGGGYVYLLPSIIALSNKHPDFVPILLANIFLGATGLAWIATLIWATRHRIGRF